MMALLIAIIAGLAMAALIRRGFRLGERNTSAAEQTAAILTAVLPPHQQARVQAVQDQWERNRKAARLAYERKRALVLWCIIIGGLLLIANGGRL